MGKLFNAFIFKLRHDLTFRITLFIGIGLAFFMTLLYLLLEKMLDEKVLNGQTMLISSLSPAQNFGIAVPVNLICFTILEFTHGSIRNKIIAGHSKAKVYLSLCINGLIFAFALITVYVLLCFGLGSIFGGFDPQGPTLGFMGSTANYIPRLIIVTVLSYVCITSLAIFFSTLFRSIGPSISVVIILIFFAYLISTILSAFSDNDSVLWALRIVDPLYALSASEMVVTEYADVGGEQVAVAMARTMVDETFIAGCISNVVYTAIFFVAGLFIFKKRDIK